MHLKKKILGAFKYLASTFDLFVKKNFCALTYYNTIFVAEQPQDESV